MKKTALLSMLLVLIIAISVLGVPAFAAEEATNTGSFYKYDENAVGGKGTIISASSDGYYYTNGKFVFDGGGAESYVAAIVAKDQLEGLTGAAVAEMAGKVTDLAELTYAEENNPGTYIAVANALSDGTYSKVKVICYDTVAPVIDSAALISYLENPEKGHDFYKTMVAASDEFTLPTEWMKDKSILTEATAEGEEENDVALLRATYEYCDPNDYYVTDDDWDSDTSSINATTYGWWRFRYKVTDRAGNESESTADFQRYVCRGETAPEINLTSSQLNVQTSGTPAGKAYSVPAPTVSSVGCSASYYYEVEKLVNGSYVVIYNSDTDKITEGYESFFTSSHVLQPAANEISGRNAAGEVEYIYRVRYIAEDDYGYTAKLTLNILTTAPDAEVDAYQVWKIVLIVIACLAAAGIIVLIFVKPKEKVAQSGRIHYGENSNNADKDNGNNAK